MIVKALVTLMGLICVIIVSTISCALMQDIVDPVTKRRVKDNQARMYGMIGFAISAAIVFGLWHYLFK